MDQIAITKLDVLSGFPSISVCVAYETRDGERLTELPWNQSIFHGCQPVYEELPGWDEDLTGATSLDDLPAAARSYLTLISERLEVPISLIGTGQGRRQVIDRVEL